MVLASIRDRTDVNHQHICGAMSRYPVVHCNHLPSLPSYSTPLLGHTNCKVRLSYHIGSNSFHLHYSLKGRRLFDNFSHKIVCNLPPQVPQSSHLFLTWLSLSSVSVEHQGLFQLLTVVHASYRMFLNLNGKTHFFPLTVQTGEPEVIWLNLKFGH